MHNKKDIDNIVYDVLRRSKALDVFPTPVDHIVQFCELNLGDSDYFHKIPTNYLAKNLDVFNRMLNKVFGGLDREIKHIYIDPKFPAVKRMFLKLHETGHHCLPWQKHICYFDNELTLTQEVQEDFEAEANFFASSALFQLDRFDADIKTLPLEIGSPWHLQKNLVPQIMQRLEDTLNKAKKDVLYWSWKKRKVTVKYLEAV